jgi:elongation factor P--beta-lysine ligase
MFMVQMSQQQAQQTATMMQGMMTMITGVLTAGNANSDKYTQQMAQMFTSFGTQQTALLQSVMNRGQATDPQEMLLKGIELANDLRAGANEAKAEVSLGSEMQETMGMIAQGVDLYNKVKGPAGMAAAVATEEG